MLKSSNHLEEAKEASKRKQGGVPNKVTVKCTYNAIVHLHVKLKRVLYRLDFEYFIPQLNEDGSSILTASMHNVYSCSHLHTGHTAFKLNTTNCTFRFD